VLQSPKLTSGDFRFVAAWVQGIEVQDTWDRYMSHRGAAPSGRRPHQGAATDVIEKEHDVSVAGGDVIDGRSLDAEPRRIRGGAR